MHKFLLNKKFSFYFNQSEIVRECIRENWLIRSNYWKSYHFKQINRSSNFDQINKIKLNVAIALLGPSICLNYII